MEKISKLILILYVLSTKYYCSELIPHTTYHANGNVKWSGTIDSLTSKKKVHSKSSLAMVNCLFRARTRMMSEKVEVLLSSE